MMVSVLLGLRASGLLDEFPTLAGYVARGEARPAYKWALVGRGGGMVKSWSKPVPIEVDRR
jgi:hypothetical protein